MDEVVDELHGGDGSRLPSRRRARVSRRRRARVPAAAALILLIALAGACAGPPEAISTGSPARPGGSSFGTPVPRPTAPTTTSPESTSTTLAPTTSTVATTTTALPISKEITSDGVLGVAFGTPMDQAVRQITAQLGYPDDDSPQDTRCDQRVTRQVSWGPLIILQGPRPDDDRFRGIVYLAGSERTGGGQNLGLLIGGMPLADTRPQPDVEAALRAALTGSTDAGYSAARVYTVTSPDRRLDAFLGDDAPTATNLVGVMLSDRADPIVC